MVIVGTFARYLENADKELFMDNRTKTAAVMAELTGDSLYGIRCPDCEEVFYLDSQGNCQRPECIPKAARRRAEQMLKVIRERSESKRD